MDDGSVEALREVLQDMSSTVELLSSGAKSGDALIRFLEDVLRTIEAWAAKYNIGLDDTAAAAAAEHPPTKPSFRDAGGARSDADRQGWEGARSVVAYRDSFENAMHPGARKAPLHSEACLNAEESRNRMGPFQGSEEARKSMDHSKPYRRPDDVKNTMLCATDYMDTQEAVEGMVYPASRNAVQYFQQSNEARSNVDFVEGETRNANVHNEARVMPNSCVNTFPVLKNDDHNHSGLGSHVVNGSQMMDQLELALDLDHDVHVNVSELVDLADQRIIHSNGGNGNEGGSFSWELQNHKEGIQFREEREDGFVETEQSLPFHDGRIDCTNQSSCRMHVAQKDARITQRQCHLTPGVAALNPAAQSMRDNNLMFTSPSHMPKNLKLDLVNQYNVRTQSAGRTDALHSSDWVDKRNESEAYHSVMDSDLR